MQNLTPTSPVVPVFDPVPRKYRVDGWTAERQRAFIAALAETGSVRHAAKRVNMAPEGAYALRRAPGADSFRAAWIAALDHGVQRLEDIALDRAIHGVEVPVYSYGKLIGSRIVHNDRLLMFILRNRLADRFGEGHRGAVLTEKARAELRAQWEQEMWEKRRRDNSPEKTLARIAEIRERLMEARKIWDAGGSLADHETWPDEEE